MATIGFLIALLGFVGILAAPLFWVLGNAGRAKIALRNGFIMFFLGLILFAVGGNNNRATPAPAVQTTGAPSTQPTKSKVQKPSESPKQKPNLEILEVSSNSDQYTRYAVGKLRNNTNRTYKYVQIEISLYDSEGNLVGTTFDNVANLEPGQIWKFKAIILEDSATRFKVSNITSF